MKSPFGHPGAGRIERVTDLNTVDPRVFPNLTHRDPQTHELVIGGVAVSQLAKQYGTPLYVVDERTARQTAREVRSALQREFARVGTEATVYYAGKAFMCVEVVKWMTEEGMYIDVSSGGELAVALAANADAAHIGFHGNNKSENEIAFAVEQGVGTIIIDSEQEIHRVAEAAKAANKRQRVRLRINSGVHAGAHDYLATAHEDQKFGSPMSRAGELVSQIASYDSLEFVGLHSHIGSQIFASDAFREAAKRLIGVYAQLADILGHPVAELNLGGGFGIPYTPDQAEHAPDVNVIAAEIADIVAQVCAEADIPLPLIAFEPGRSIIGRSGVTLYSVGTTKSVDLAGTDAHSTADAVDAGFDQRLYVSVDGGMSDNARPALYGSDYHAVIANRTSEAEAALVRVVGKHCESGDIVVPRVFLPADVTPGDLLTVPVTGAYCWSLSSNYNYLPRPAVVAVNDGRSRIIVRGETTEELLARSVY